MKYNTICFVYLRYTYVALVAVLLKLYNYTSLAMREAHSRVGAHSSKLLSLYRKLGQK